MPIPGTVPLTAPIAPTDPADVFPSHDDSFGKGGYRSVANAAARDAIPAERRREGMLVRTLDDGKYWRLNTDLTTWDQAFSKSDVGLNNVDNTSDANKPVSTQQAAADAAVQAAAAADATAKANAAQAAAEGTAASALSAHVAAPDPHPQYTTAVEAAAAAPVQSVAGKSGAVTLVRADISGLGAEDLSQNGRIERVQDKEYVIVLKSKVAGRITEFTRKSGSGTATVEVRIEGVAVTGLTSLTVDGTERSATPSSGNLFAIGATVSFVVSGNADCRDFDFTLAMEAQ